MWGARRTIRCFALIHGVVRFEDRGGRGKFISVLTVGGSRGGG